MGAYPNLSNITSAMHASGMAKNPLENGTPNSDLGDSKLPSSTLQNQNELFKKGLAKLSSLDTHGAGFSDPVRTYIRTAVNAKTEGRTLTPQERGELKKIEDSFCHSMAGNTLKLIAGHAVRLLGCDQKIAKGIFDEAQIQKESERVLTDIDIRLGKLTTMYLRAKQLQPIARMASAAFSLTEAKFVNAIYSQAVHNATRIDCSGLVGEYLTRLLAQAGIKENLTGVTTSHLFHMNNSRSGDRLVQKLRKYFNVADLKEIGIENLQPGDAIVRRRQEKGHTGVYLEGGQVMHSTRDSDQNGFGIDTLHVFLRKNRVHRVVRLKPQYANGQGAVV